MYGNPSHHFFGCYVCHGRMDGLWNGNHTLPPQLNQAHTVCSVHHHAATARKPNQTNHTKLRTHGDGVDARLGDGRGLLQGEWCGHEGLHAVVGFVVLGLWGGCLDGWISGGSGDMDGWKDGWIGEVSGVVLVVVANGSLVCVWTRGPQRHGRANTSQTRPSIHICTSHRQGVYLCCMMSDTHLHTPIHVPGDGARGGRKEEGLGHHGVRRKRGEGRGFLSSLWWWVGGLEVRCEQRWVDV